MIAIDDLVIEFDTPSGVVRALDGANLDVGAGERLALVGESGSGKSTLANAIGALLPRNARSARGRVIVADSDIATLERRALRRLRRETLGFIPQDPIATLDPTMRVGKQLALVGGEEPARMLADVRIADPDLVVRRFPHQLSGGMAQRVAIAIALARSPRVLIADEPTSALDAEIRDDVLALMFEAAERTGATVIWLTHDLDSVGRWCRRVAVMYRGRIVEDGVDVLSTPTHPYTHALLAAMPSRLRREVEVSPYSP